MSLSLSEVEHIAELARLTLSQAEKERLQEQLSAVLAYADRLQELETETVSPARLPARRSLRADLSRPSTPRDDVLFNAPASDGAYFLVPPIGGPTADTGGSSS